MPDLAEETRQWKKRMRSLPKRQRVQEDPVFRAQMERTEGLMFESLDPGEKTLPEDGAWIMVLLPPNTEYTVEPLSCWFAVADESRERYKARIETPKGPLWLYPHEYVLVGNVAEYITMATEDEGGVKVNYISDRTELKSDQLFYLRQRGIPYADAVLMLLGTVKDQFFCYLTFPVQYQVAMAGVGVRSYQARSNVLATIKQQHPKEYAQLVEETPTNGQ